MSPPSREWLPFLRMGLAYFVVLVLASLAAVIALGKVNEKDSYGLREIVSAFGVLAGGCAGYAFGKDA